MNDEQLKLAADEIRQLVATDKVEEAISQLKEIAQEVEQDYWDEAITISANWTRLQADIRNSLIDTREATMRRNRLIDQILELTRAMENHHPAPHFEQVGEREGAVVGKPAPESKKENRGRDLLIALIILLLVAAAIVAGVVMSRDQESEVDTFCDDFWQEALAQLEKGQLELAYNSFSAIGSLCEKYQQQANQQMKVIFERYMEMPPTVQPERSPEGGEEAPSPPVAERDSLQQPRSPGAIVKIPPDNRLEDMVRVMPDSKAKQMKRLLQGAHQARESGNAQMSVDMLHQAESLMDSIPEVLQKEMEASQQELVRVALQESRKLEGEGQIKEALKKMGVAARYSNDPQILRRIQLLQAELKD